MDTLRPTLLDTDPDLIGVSRFLNCLQSTRPGAAVSEVVRQLHAKYDQAFVEQLKKFAQISNPSVEDIDCLIGLCADVAEYYQLSPELVSELIDEILDAQNESTKVSG